MARQRFVNNHIDNNAGYVTLMSVVIFSAIGIAIVVSLILLGLSVARTSYLSQQAKGINQLAHGCADEGLMYIRENESFTGTNNSTISGQQCSYTVINLGGESREIRASASGPDNIERRVKVIISAINPGIVISSWQEVETF